MSLAKKITAVHFENSNFSNGDENTGQRYTINVSDYNIQIDPEFYTGSFADKALSGKYRQNLRGLRPSVELRYDGSTQSTRMRNLFNDIIVAFVTNNADSITFYPDASKADNFEVVLEPSSYGTNYRNTTGTFVPSLRLVSLNEITSIPSYLEGP